MGNIRQVLYNQEVPKSMLNNRLTVELCENVHVHYRNLRLEFSKEEFLFLLKHLKGVDEEIIENFDYGDNFQSLVETFELPESTEFDDRLQIEEQVEGHYHVHYRNLRIETQDLRELGYWEIPKPIGMDQIYYRDILSKMDIKGMNIEDRKIGDLLVTIYDDPRMVGARNVPVSESPCLRLLKGDEAGYLEYINHVKERKRRNLGVEDNTHSLERTKATIRSLEKRDYVGCFIVVFGNLIGDGQHRAAWLYHKYGNDKVIKVINVDV
tara:strand:+ start:5536 stop:6336 length:801 start_codon:yes stop_codon:yes gene_type:complete